MFKIFVIGFHRTGTRSVNAALQQLGWNIIHYPCPSTNELFCDEFLAGPPWSILNVCDGLSDIVTVSYYRKLLDLYPDSKFILARFQEHNAEVMATFNNNLLVYDANDGWEPLCQFLKVEKPPFDFPRIIK